MTRSFDVVVTTGFFAVPDFAKTFGRFYQEKKVHEVPPAVKAGIVNAVLVGEIVGLTLCGWVAERIGFKRTISVALVLVSLFLLLLFFANHTAIFIVGQFLCGIPLGVFQTLPATYASEILPVPLRPYLTTYVNFCWAFGALLGSAAQRGAYGLQEGWSWRLPIALQWIWPLPLIVAVLLAPESPWWLVRRNNREKALKNLKRLTPNFDAMLDEIVTTNEHEATFAAGTKYSDCFRDGNGRRTEATTIVWAIQMICGSTLIYFSTTFFEKAGMSHDNAFTLTPIMYGVGCAGTFASWFLISYFGRQSLYMWGCILMATIMFAIGIAGNFRESSAANWYVNLTTPP